MFVVRWHQPVTIKEWENSQTIIPGSRHQNVISHQRKETVSRRKGTVSRRRRRCNVYKKNSLSKKIKSRQKNPDQTHLKRGKRKNERNKKKERKRQKERIVREIFCLQRGRRRREAITTWSLTPPPCQRVKQKDCSMFEKEGAIDGYLILEEGAEGAVSQCDFATCKSCVRRTTNCLWVSSCWTRSLYDGCSEDENVGDAGRVTVRCCSELSSMVEGGDCSTSLCFCIYCWRLCNRVLDFQVV